MKNVLVTGGNGQLASCIKDVAKFIDGYSFLYVDIDELDITNFDEVSSFFDKDLSFCVNCAAYTAVDKAETDIDIAEKVNIIGPRNLAKACEEKGVTFIQISTDFVFDGKQAKLYTEKDSVNPLSVYGESKLGGERATAILKEHFIIRTSWLYSEYGLNFLKTMLRLGDEREELSVVCDQIGTPTYAGDLAKIIVKIITEDSEDYGIYHYSNEGVASWYDFAKTIFDESGAQVKLLPINSEAYPTPAERPRFSTMDKSKIKEILKIEIPYWRDSLKDCLIKLKTKD